MSGLDGKITIERELRPCIVHIPRNVRAKETNGGGRALGIVEEHNIKALFHCWNPVTGNALVEYEDGSIHEAEPKQIRFVDNAMSENAFPEMEDKLR